MSSKVRFARPGGLAAMTCWSVIVCSGAPASEEPASTCCQVSVPRSGMSDSRICCSSGLERNGEERNGLDRNGEERNGDERKGLERNGEERNGDACSAFAVLTIVV